MKFSILQLLSESYKIIKLDKLILAPYLIFFLIIHSVMNMVSISFSEESFIKGNIMIILLFGWILELFFKGFTIAMAVHIQSKKEHSISLPFKQTLHKFHQLILSLGSITIPFFIFAKYIFPSNQTDIISTLLSGIGVIFMICFVCVIQILPVIIIVENNPWYIAIKKSLLFVKVYFKEILIFTSMIFSLLILIFFCSAMFRGIPVLGETLFQVICKGVGYTYLYVTTAIFYLLLIFPQRFKEKEDLKVDSPAH